MSKIIGIDFGTTYSRVAAVVDNEVRIFPDARGELAIPSTVSFTKDREFRVGRYRDPESFISDTAIVKDGKFIRYSENNIFSIKRLLGKKYKTLDPILEQMSYLPYELNLGDDNNDLGDDNNVLVNIGGRDYSPSEIAAVVLQELKKNAEVSLDEEVTQAVVSVPVSFGPSERQAMVDAGKIAGLEILRMIPAPLAVVLGVTDQGRLAYRDDDIKIAVYNLGAGTFDISILKGSFFPSKGWAFREISSNGDSFLGGEDFDQTIVEWITDEFRSRHGINLHDTLHLPIVFCRLKERVEEVKRSLSEWLNYGSLDLSSIICDVSWQQDFDLEFNRNELKRITSPLIEHSIELCRQALSDVEMQPSDIDIVIYVGGQIGMPAVREAVQQLFPTERLNFLGGSAEACVLGAAIHGSIWPHDLYKPPLRLRTYILQQNIPFSLGVEVIEIRRSFLYHEVPHRFEMLIPKYSNIPAEKSHEFIIRRTEDKENAAAVEVRVFKGESENTTDNEMIRRLCFADLPPSPEGDQEISITFSIFANRILTVSVKDQQTGKELKPVTDQSTSKELKPCEIYI